MNRRNSVLLTALLLLGAAAAPIHAQEIVTHTADVSGEWVFFDLDDDDVTISVQDPRVSTEWDIGVLGTEITVNGGASGPGNVTAYCICDNQFLSDEEIQNLTAESVLADFGTVTAAAIPGDDAWDPGAIGSNPWYRYNIAGQHFIWPTFDVYLVKRGDEVYKVQFTSFYGLEAEPRHLSLRYAKLTD